jgi:hypothetical protein
MKFIKLFEKFKINEEVPYQLDEPQNLVAWTNEEKDDLTRLGVDEIGRNTATFRNVIEVNSHGITKSGDARFATRLKNYDGETLVVNLKKSKKYGDVSFYEASSNSEAWGIKDDGSESRQGRNSIYAEDWVIFKRHLHKFMNNLGIDTSLEDMPSE